MVCSYCCSNGKKVAGANTVSKAYERRPLNACFGHKLTLFLAEWSSISSWVQIDPFSLVNGLYSWCAPHLPRGRINSLWWPLSLTLSHHRFSHQIKTRIKSQFNHQMWLADFKTKADPFASEAMRWKIVNFMYMGCTQWYYSLPVPENTQDSK